MTKVAELMLRDIPAERFPRLRETARELAKSGYVYAKEFEVGLGAVLDGVERLR